MCKKLYLVIINMGVFITLPLKTLYANIGYDNPFTVQKVLDHGRIKYRIHGNFSLWNSKEESQTARAEGTLPILTYYVQTDLLDQPPLNSYKVIYDAFKSTLHSFQDDFE